MKVDPGSMERNVTRPIQSGEPLRIALLGICHEFEGSQRRCAMRAIGWRREELSLLCGLAQSPIMLGESMMHLATRVDVLAAHVINQSLLDGVTGCGGPRLDGPAALCLSIPRVAVEHAESLEAMFMTMTIPEEPDEIVDCSLWFVAASAKVWGNSFRCPVCRDWFAGSSLESG
nr:hypothetical protein CFP56_78581 [Quercus suber]